MDNPARLTTLSTVPSEGVVYAHALGTIVDMLQETATHIERSVTELSRRFQELASGAEQQGQHVDAIIATANALTLQNETITLADFTALFSTTLNDAMMRITDVTRIATELAADMKVAIANVDSLKGFVGQVQKVNRQVNMIALNAIIEAARAGEAGRSFSVVANEVKGISAEISTLANAIQGKIGSVESDIHRTHERLGEVAALDTTRQAEAQERLAGLLQALLRQNHNFGAILRQASEASAATANAIAGLTVNMQFQDRACQYIDNSLRIIRMVIAHLQSADAAGNIGDPARLIHAIEDTCQLSEFKRLFQLKTGVAANASDTAPRDGIELF